VHRYYIRTVQPTRCNVSQFIYFCKTLKHVSDDFSVHHQELKTAHTAWGKSDMWLTVHRNSVWIRNQLDVTFVLFLFLFYKLLNMFRATMCPSSGADGCVMLSLRVGIVPWLQGGCQDRLAGSVSIAEFVAVLRTPQWTHYLITGLDSLPAATAHTNSSMYTIPDNRSWQPSCSHGTYEHLNGHNTW
jgi:hypothetical protein